MTDNIRDKYPFSDDFTDKIRLFLTKFEESGGNRGNNTGNTGNNSNKGTLTNCILRLHNLLSNLDGKQKTDSFHIAFYHTIFCWHKTNCWIHHIYIIKSKMSIPHHLIFIGINNTHRSLRMNRQLTGVFLVKIHSLEFQINSVVIAIQLQ